VTLQSIAVVTGGSRGIGRVIIDELSRTRPVLCISRGERTFEQCGAGHYPIHTLQLDLSEIHLLDGRLAGWFQTHSGYRVSRLILNAASLALGQLEDARPETVEAIFRTNVVSATTLVSWFVKSQLFDPAGSQVTYVISSLARFDLRLTFSGIGLYSSTKAAISRLAMVQAREFNLNHPYIRIARVHPGIVHTEMQTELRANTGLDPRFFEKTAGLPPYRPGEWENAAPLDAMRTISPEMAADFVLWATDRGDHEATEFDYYTASGYHAVRDERLAARLKPKTSSENIKKVPA
jgi:NAD(P)-dependent dehydrogenase (short-subunit alcohol dehydrogenase family)